jgi:hypothetical protein
MEAARSGPILCGILHACDTVAVSAGHTGMVSHIIMSCAQVMDRCCHPHAVFPYAGACYRGTTPIATYFIGGAGLVHVLVLLFEQWRIGVKAAVGGYRVQEVAEAELCLVSSRLIVSENIKHNITCTPQQESAGTPGTCTGCYHRARLKSTAGAPSLQLQAMCSDVH